MSNLYGIIEVHSYRLDQVPEVTIPSYRRYMSLIMPEKWKHNKQEIKIKASKLARYDSDKII